MVGLKRTLRAKYRAFHPEGGSRPAPCKCSLVGLELVSAAYAD